MRLKFPGGGQKGAQALTGGYDVRSHDLACGVKVARSHAISNGALLGDRAPFGFRNAVGLGIPDSDNQLDGRASP